jgi:hypothetical protein
LFGIKKDQVDASHSTRSFLFETDTIRTEVPATEHFFLRHIEPMPVHRKVIGCSEKNGFRVEHFSAHGACRPFPDMVFQLFPTKLRLHIQKRDSGSLLDLCVQDMLLCLKMGEELMPNGFEVHRFHSVRIGFTYHHALDCFIRFMLDLKKSDS